MGGQEPGVRLHLVIPAQGRKAHAGRGCDLPQLGQRVPGRRLVETGGKGARRPLVAPAEHRPAPAQLGRRRAEAGPERLPRVPVESLDLEPPAVGAAERGAGRGQRRPGEGIAETGRNYEVVGEQEQPGLEDGRAHDRHRMPPPAGDAGGEGPLRPQDPRGDGGDLEPEPPGDTPVSPVHLHEAGEGLNGRLAPGVLGWEGGGAVPGDLRLDRVGGVEAAERPEPAGAGVDGNPERPPCRAHVRAGRTPTPSGCPTEAAAGCSEWRRAQCPRGRRRPA